MAAKNYAGMGSAELRALIPKATQATLDAMREQLEPLGYSEEGVVMMMIANREAELAGEDLPHAIPTGAGLPPIVGDYNKGA